MTSVTMYSSARRFPRLEDQTHAEIVNGDIEALNQNYAYDVASTAALRRDVHLHLNVPQRQPAVLDQDEPDSPSSTWNRRKREFVQGWRDGVKCEVSGPPLSPQNMVNFPTSPVAEVHPGALKVTSSPPYQLAAASRSFREPRYMEDLLTLDTSTDILDGSSVSSEEITYQSGSPYTTDSSNTKDLRDNIRWIPSRIKYSFLSLSKGMHSRFRTSSIRSKI